MTVEFLLYANLVLASRLLYLTHDGPLSPTANLLLSAAQGAVVAVVFAFNTASLAALATVVSVGLLSGWLERYLDLRKGFRLVTLALLLLIPDYFSTFGAGLEVRAAVTAAAGHLGSQLSLLQLPPGGGVRGTLLVAFGFLLLANEANILVRALFHHCRLEPRMDGEEGVASEGIDRQEYNAGRVIGFLERWLMFMVILYSASLNALAFIVAAKGLARFRQLEDKHFAEYMLIGTLFSALTAVVIGFWVRTL